MNAYYSDSNANVIGPVTPTELNDLYRSGKITGATQVCAEGSNEWILYCEAMKVWNTTRPSSMANNGGQRVSERRLPKGLIIGASVCALGATAAGMVFFGLSDPSKKTFEQAEAKFTIGQIEAAKHEYTGLIEKWPTSKWRGFGESQIQKCNDILSQRRNLEDQLEAKEFGSARGTIDRIATVNAKAIDKEKELARVDAAEAAYKRDVESQRELQRKQEQRGAFLTMEKDVMGVTISMVKTGYDLSGKSLEQFRAAFNKQIEGLKGSPKEMYETRIGGLNKTIEGYDELFNQTRGSFLTKTDELLVKINSQLGAVTVPEEFRGSKALLVQMRDTLVKFRSAVAEMPRWTQLDRLPEGQDPLNLLNHLKLSVTNSDALTKNFEGLQKICANATVEMVQVLSRFPRQEVPSEFYPSLENLEKLGK